MDKTKKNILQTYLNRLTNLSGNNRSLLLLKLYAGQLLDLHEVNYLNSERSFAVINALIAGKEKKLCQVVDSRVEANNVVSTKLKKLQRADKFIFEERGSNDLHVGWPFLRGKFSDGTLVRCPLLFFPVTLVQENNQWILQPRKEAGITLNKSFLLAFAFYNKVQVDEDLLEANFDDFNTDSTVFRTEVYQLLKDRLEINFNPDNFRDELFRFEEFKKDDFKQSQKNGKIILQPEAVLGIFPQAGSQLVPDYIHLIEDESIQDLEDFFLKKHGDNTTDTNSVVDYRLLPIKEEKLFIPFTIDAYQENAVKAIKHGHSIVVQGPPGTGKSQLICNLMADAVASGKRVLLVCQKRAALDVVYSRLKEIELEDFLGLVHDFRNDRKEIFSKIANQIDRIEDFRARNRGIDVIQLERKFVQLCRRIDQLTEELDDFKKSLFDDQECGMSVKELYLTSDLQGDSINIKQEYQYFNFQNLNEFIHKLKVYSNYASWFEIENYAWRDRKSFSTWHFTDLKEIEFAVLDVSRFQAKITSRVKEIISTELNLHDCESFFRREMEVMGMISVLKDDETYLYFQTMAGQHDDETSMLWLLNTERVLLNCFDEHGLEALSSNDQLGLVQLALQQRMASHKNIFTRMKWEFFSSHKFLLKRLLVANGLTFDKKGLKILESRIDNRLNFEHHLTAIKQKIWLINIPADYSEQNFKRWFEKQKLAVRAKLAFSNMPEINKAIDIQQQTRITFGKLIRELLEVLSDIPDRRKMWLKYLSPFQISRLMEEPHRVTEFCKTLRNDFDNLTEFDKLKEELTEHERNVVVKLRDHLGVWDATKMESCFQNSLRLTWIDHIETKYPVLRTVSSIKMSHMQIELQQLVAEKKNLSKDILLIKARDRVFENIEYNRLNNRITYRDLYHQVTKKRKTWPVRKVISEFYDELFTLMPCWMASPESVSAIFPMRELFDLVIFDEASQCFAERGIPAMFRAKQLLVAGDDKQLRPNELYQARWEEEGEEPDQEVDSLLELSARYLSTFNLQGHYRSQNMELIDFSNQHFYGGRLRLLPDRHHINLQQASIEYIKVEGVWEDQINKVEAATVVERIISLVKLYPEKEIGVVTFNAPQQMLILDLLEDACNKEAISIPSSLFVKNIENVQGDERDIIIFSIGYAPDKKNKMTMQFGSLNLAGGENRLNVAITRAREKIVIVTSILPEQLQVDAVKNDGPRLLRQYLEFAQAVHQRDFKPYVNRNETKSPTWYLNSKIKHWADHKFKDIVFEIESLPFSDLNFKTSHQQYLGVILTDDSRFFESLSAKDMYAYTPTLLAKKNWHYNVVFSRNFWQDRQKLEDTISTFIGLRD